MSTLLEALSRKSRDESLSTPADKPAKSLLEALAEMEKRKAAESDQTWKMVRRVLASLGRRPIRESRRRRPASGRRPVGLRESAGPCPRGMRGACRCQRCSSWGGI